MENENEGLLRRTGQSVNELYEMNEINMIFGQNWTISVIVRLRDEKKRARAPEFRAQVDRMAKSGIINPNRLFQEYFGLLNS